MISKQTREEGQVFPAALYEKIKVRPPPTRKFTQHSHIIDEQWLRLENSKNYSPEESIRKAHQKAKLALLKPSSNRTGLGHSPDSGMIDSLAGGEESPSKDFREKLVDFLM